MLLGVPEIYRVLGGFMQFFSVVPWSVRGFLCLSLGSNGNLKRFGFSSVALRGAGRFRKYALHFTLNP